MINFDFTNEDIETLKKYRSQGYLAINQLLNSNSESDLNFLMSCDKDSDEYNFYTKDAIEEKINLIKDIYGVMLKAY